MVCKTVKMPGGGHVIVCGPRPRQQRCSCGRSTGLLCDWPTPERKSGMCDKPVCLDCRRIDGDKDYCPFHRGDPPKTQAELDLAGEQAADDAAKILGVTR